VALGFGGEGEEVRGEDFGGEGVKILDDGRVVGWGDVDWSLLGR
jgi:hypothetical protein